MTLKKKPAAKKVPAKKAAPRKAKVVKAGQNKESAAMRRKLFVEAYLSNGENATHAAVAAGFSEKSAASQGSRLLKNAKVQQELDSRRTQVLQKAGLTTERVIQHLADTLFFDPRKLYREDGTLKPITELDDATAMALAGVEVTEEFGPAPVDTELEPQPHGGGLKRSRGQRVVVGYTAKVKWLDKNTARDQAMKHLGQYKKDNAQGGEAVGNALSALIGQMRRSALPVVRNPDE